MANQLVTKRVAKCRYSFSADGGVVGTIQPQVTDVIPVNAIITRVTVDCITAVTGSSSTVAITGGGVTLVGAQTLATNKLDADTTVSDLLRAGAIVTSLGYLPIKATSSAPLKVVVAVGALTAGVFDLYVEYSLS